MVSPDLPPSPIGPADAPLATDAALVDAALVEAAPDFHAPGQTKGQREPMPAGFWPIWTTVLLDLIGFGIALPVLGIYAIDRFNASGLMIGLLGSAYSFAQFLAAPVLGKMSDRYGRKPLLMFSLIGTAVAALLTGLAGSLWLLILWRFADGLSGASYGVASSAIADIATPERRSTLLGMLGAAFGIGFTIGPAIGALMTWIGGPRAPFFLLAALSAINAVVMFIRVKETRHLAADQTAELAASGELSGLATSWRGNGLPLLLCAGITTAFAFTAFETLFSAFGRTNLGLTQSSAGWALAVVGVVSSIVQGGLIGPVSKKISNLRLGGVGLATTAGGLAMFGSANGWLLLIPAVIAIAIGQGFAGPSLSAEVANRIAPEKRGTVLGVDQSWRSGASVIGPLAGGLVFDHIDHAAPFYLGAALFVIAGITVLRASRRSVPAAASTA